MKIRMFVQLTLLCLLCAHISFADAKVSEEEAKVAVEDAVKVTQEALKKAEEVWESAEQNNKIKSKKFMDFEARVEDTKKEAETIAHGVEKGKGFLDEIVQITGKIQTELPQLMESVSSSSGKALTAKSKAKHAEMEANASGSIPASGASKDDFSKRKQTAERVKKNAESITKEADDAANLIKAAKESMKNIQDSTEKAERTLQKLKIVVIAAKIKSYSEEFEGMFKKMDTAKEEIEKHRTAMSEFAKKYPNIAESTVKEQQSIMESAAADIPKHLITVKEAETSIKEEEKHMNEFAQNITTWSSDDNGTQKSAKAKESEMKATSLRTNAHTALNATIYDVQKAEVALYVAMATVYATTSKKNYENLTQMKKEATEAVESVTSAQSHVSESLLPAIKAQLQLASTAHTQIIGKDAQAEEMLRITESYKSEVLNALKSAEEAKANISQERVQAAKTAASNAEREAEKIKELILNVSLEVEKIIKIKNNVESVVAAHEQKTGKSRSKKAGQGVSHASGADGDEKNGLTKVVENPPRNSSTTPCVFLSAISIFMMLLIILIH